MRVVLFGATGMVGRGVLRECLRDERVEAVLAIGRSPAGTSHPKLREVVEQDLFALEPITGYDTCFFCLGVSSVGVAPEEYERITYQLTLSVARKLPADTTFVYVSGAGTDSTERGRVRWARVKGATENALARLPLRTFAFRPGYIQPLHGITSKTPLYRVLYRVAMPLYPALKRLFPRAVTTTEDIGLAMLAVASGYEKPILENADITALARRDRPAGS
ncbi:epimerase [Amycolatopsis sp. SID8362]|uniref:epimerase n=1 Tax=Amycolatopsis sp. SID8362 TaxID=2690346 RepID=UPI0013715CB4|nr:epimerase [Amycolatopsis sp. SID8362]NBH12485.1 epimerase [Amycolatopsis sp. SID8362]NED49177.1 epimerase [Amycolatopsis sp. SID8362]